MNIDSLNEEFFKLNELPDCVLAYWLAIVANGDFSDLQDPRSMSRQLSIQFSAEDQAVEHEEVAGSILVPRQIRPFCPVQIVRHWCPIKLAIALFGAPTSSFSALEPLPTATLHWAAGIHQSVPSQVDTGYGDRFLRLCEYIKKSRSPFIIVATTTFYKEKKLSRLTRKAMSDYGYIVTSRSPDME